MIVLPTGSRKRSMNGRENMIAIQTEKSVKKSMIIGDTITNKNAAQQDGIHHSFAVVHSVNHLLNGSFLFGIEIYPTVEQLL